MFEPLRLEAYPLKEFLIEEGYSQDLDRLMPIIESGDRECLLKLFDDLHNEPTITWPAEIVVAACFDEPVRQALREAGRREKILREEVGDEYNYIQRYPEYTALVIISLFVSLVIAIACFAIPG